MPSIEPIKLIFNYFYAPLSFNSIFELYLTLKIFLKFNLLFLLFTLILLGIIFYGSKLLNLQFFNNFGSTPIIKFFIIIYFLISFSLHIYTFYIYIIFSKTLITYNLYNKFMLFPIFNIWFDVSWLNIFSNYLIDINFSFDFFGYILLTLAYLTGIFSLLALDTRLYWKNFKFIFSFNVFLVIVFFYTTITNVFFFLLLYELLLLPSFLLVYFVSPSRRALQASLYFVIWTQIGSFLVICAVAYLLLVSGGYDFFLLKNFNFNYYETWILYLLFFFGFGFKVPIWPFHYWLTKTHVEAPAGFSMYLSGFLVKSALYGFYKFTNILGSEIDTFFFSAICIIGVIDSSLKMWGQTDLKKLVAYGTIQEMNLIFLVFCWGDSYGLIGGFFFCFMHAILSTLMFFLVDCVQKRFHSRSVVELSGLLHITPNLALAILFMCIFYSGVPGTLKFTVEFYIFNGLFDASPFLCNILMLSANVLGLIGFSKCWFNVVFGSINSKISFLPIDLNFKELGIISNCFILLFITTLIFNFCF